MADQNLQGYLIKSRGMSLLPIPIVLQSLTLSPDEQRADLQAIYNKKKKDLDKEVASKDRLEGEIRRGDEDEEAEEDLARLERSVSVLTLEERILKCTLDIYILTYKQGKTDAENQKLLSLWKELDDMPFLPDKMKKDLDPLWNQLREGL
jgi:hypothetical protein